MPILFVTYSDEPSMMEFSKNLPQILKETLDVKDFILHSKEKNKFDKLNANLQISIFLHPTEDRIKFSEDMLATKIQDALNKRSISKHHVVVHLGTLGVKYFN